LAEEYQGEKSLHGRTRKPFAPSTPRGGGPWWGIKIPKIGCPVSGGLLGLIWPKPVQSAPAALDISRPNRINAQSGEFSYAMPEVGE